MMALFERLNTDFEHADNRGRLVQIIHDGYKQVNILETKKGVTRGSHYHKRCREAFYVVRGRVEVSLKRGEEAETIEFGTDDFFAIDANTFHSMFFLEDCLMIQMYDIPVEFNDGTKDIYVE